MSQLNVDTIKKADGTGNLSVPAETGTVVTTASPSLGRRNLIINGDMAISQRNTSFTISGSSNVYTLDRFYQVTNASAATFVISQDTETPANFKNSLKFSVTTADTDLTNQRCLIGQHIEGQNVSHLNWGTADAQDVTLSFWVRSSLTGTFGGTIINRAEDYSYPFTYTISSADTWEYKTVTITGPTAGTWLTSTDIGMRIYWSMGTGSYRLGTAGSWSANRYEGATGQVDPVSTTGATWYITGVQLEVGDTATPFEHRSYGEELALCQRYYEKWFEYGDGSNTMIATMAAYTSGSIYGGIFFPYKRVKPSISFGPSSGDPFRQYGNNNYVALAASEMLAQDIGNRTARINADQSGQAVQGYAYFLQFLNGLGGYIEFDAEL